MFEVLGSIWWLIVALGVLVTFHEFGHFWVARRLGVKVLKFSVGFGRALVTRHGKDGTAYSIAAIPLGGYVKMLDEREGEVAPEELPWAFNRKPVGRRIAIVAAGPVFNLVFAVFAFWLMFLLGIPEVRPIVGQTSGIAAEAGLRSGDQIVSLGGESTDTWSHAILSLVTNELDRKSVQAVVQAADGQRRTLTLDFSQLNSDFDEEHALKAAGITPWRANIPAIVGEVSPDSPARQAGMKTGDRITSIGGEPVSDWSQVGPLVQKHGADGQPVAVDVERAGGTLSLSITPQKEKTGLFSTRLLLGITNKPPDAATVKAIQRAFMTLRYGPLDAIGPAFSEMNRLTQSTLGLLGRMLTGSASVRNISGPIGIAQFANDSANAGLSNFMFFLGLISLSLGILNLLPIPVLDGGHLLYYLIELVKGSPVSDQVQVAGQYVGLVG